MGDTKFTPGPWEAHPKDKGMLWGGSTLYSVVTDGAKTLAYVIAYDARKEVAEHDANAHLIAAAPEMYHRLIMMAERCNELMQDVQTANLDEDEMVNALRAIRDAAQADAAKARGESNG